MSETSRQHSIGTGRPQGHSEISSSAMHDMGQTVSNAASSAMEAGSDMASSATAQIKTFAGEIERMARNNPLGAVAGALIIGVLIGMMGRGRN